MRIAIVQDGPEYNDLRKTVDKTCNLISEAAKEQVDLIVFGESWLCGYPAWLDVCSDVGFWDHEPVKEVWRDMYENAIDVNGSEVSLIQKTIKECGVWAIIGANEKITKGPGSGTLFNTVFTINHKGELANHHRKLMPTFTEKLVHGLGDGAGLKSVDTPFGKLGALICWEHWMPLTRQAMHEEAEDLHIALWPYVKEMHQVCSRQYAFEGRCHVVSVGQIMSAEEIPPGLTLPDSIGKKDLLLKGGSSIYGPNGDVLLAPVYNDRKIIYQDLDLSSNIKEKMNLSVTGHYNRPDVFRFDVDRRRQF